MYYKYKGELKHRSENIHHRVAYRCSLKYRNRVHGKNADVTQCDTPEISAKILEPTVFEMVQKYMTDSTLLKKHLQYSSEDVVEQRKQIKLKVTQIDSSIKQHREQKKVYLKQYTDGKINRDLYSENCRTLDEEIATLELEKEQITTRIPNEIDEELIDTSLSMYCESIKARLKHCDTFDQKRKFLLDFVGQVSFDKDTIGMQGKLPVNSEIIHFALVRRRAKNYQPQK